MNQYISAKIKKLNIILIIMVVMLHGGNTTQFSNISVGYDVVRKIENFLAAYIYGMAVPGFFIISGYLMFINYDWHQYVRKVKNRLFTLVIPYLIWNAIALAFFQIFTFIPGVRDRMTTIKLVRSWSGVMRGIVLFSDNQVNWFIFQLILLSVMSFLIFWFIRKKLGILFLVVLLIINIMPPDFKYISTESFEVCFRIDALFYYSLGGYIAINFRQFISNHQPSGNFNTKSIFCLVSAFLTGMSLIFISKNTGVNMFAPGVVIEFLVLVIALDCFENWILNNRILENYIDSFFLLQMHYLIMYPIKKVVALLAGNKSIIMLIMYFLCPVITILGCVVIQKWVSRRLPKTYKLLVGGRTN